MIALAGPIRGEVVLQDDFSNLSQWQDLSTAVTWSGGGSVFQTMGGVARLTALGGDVSGYTTASSLKTFTALDHRFAKPINRTLQTDSISVTVGGPEDAVFSLLEGAGHSYPAITYVQPSGGTGTRGVDYAVDGATYTVEHDDDLHAPWSSGGVTVASVQAAEEGLERVTVRLNDPVSAGSQRFMRVKVAVPVH